MTRREWNDKKIIIPPLPVSPKAKKTIPPLPVSLKAEGGLGMLVGVVKSGRGVGSSRRSFSESGTCLAVALAKAQNGNPVK